MKKINGAIGFAVSKHKNSRNISVCVYATKCDGVEIGGGGSLSIQGMISNAETTSGVSHSVCADASVAAGGGVSGSLCTSNGDDVSVYGGFNTGVKNGVGAKQCIQFTECITF